MTAIDAVATSAAIAGTYQRYLGSLLPLRDEAIRRQLDTRLAEQATFWQGPLLEMTPPFIAGQSLADLVDAQVLSPGFTRYFSDELPGSRPLYLHQEQAIRRALDGRNLVVATGTGSGKTESFLVPILDHLAREHSAGTLGPGVRALLLYPMNALANDQLERLRRLLAATPEVTFGRYTGETKESTPDAVAQYQTTYGRDPLPNEMVSREQMRTCPPHLLLTNYAMLEYLLLRPRDMDLFEGPSTGHWRFLVVDEAHVYDGVKGTEIALLLRRVRQRVAQGSALQYLASSATVGQDLDRVADFGEALFGAPFQPRTPHDPGDVVTATRRPLPDGDTWGPLDLTELRLLARDDDPAAAWRRQHADRELQDEAAMRLLQRRLAQAPESLDSLARVVFPDSPIDLGRHAVADLVELGHHVRTTIGAAVLSARYHLFASAVEGAFACLSRQGPHVQLTRHAHCPECDAAMFELAACKQCGQLHLVGRLSTDNGQEQLTFAARQNRTHWVVVGDPSTGTDEDEDALASAAVTDPQAATLCTTCGTFAGPAATGCPSCGGSDLRQVLRVDAGRELTVCRGCGGRSPRQVRRFESGTDAAAAVLATALYQNLPADQPNDRHLLMFSDSRQQAAFAAPYLEQTYTGLVHRTLIARALRAQVGEELSTHDVAALTRHAALAAGVLTGRDTGFTDRRRVGTWLHREMLEGAERTSLEGVGLATVSLAVPHLPVPRALTRLGLTDTEAWALLDQLTQTLRTQGAVAPVEDSVDLTDEYLAPRNRPVYVRGHGSEPTQGVLSWCPSGTARSNRRLDYLTKVLHSLGAPDGPGTMLDEIWKYLSGPAGPGWLVSVTDRERGPVWRINPSALRWSWTADTTLRWRCGQCGRLASASVRGICPTNGCAGTLVSEPARVDPRDHYAATYLTLSTTTLRAEEHTAQIGPDVASRLQEQFSTGEVNVLSCSTTFELGVDVGDLQTVFLRNVPPTTANYVQRAGRAGRRTESAALVLTYAPMRSHDQAMFHEPVAMVQGTVRAPVVTRDNVRVARRHAHSIALAGFLRASYDSTGAEFRTVGEFFDGADATGDQALRGYLQHLPEGIEDAVSHVLPGPVRAALDEPGNPWPDQMWSLVELAGQEYRDEVGFFRGKINDAVAAQKYQQAGQLQRVVATLERQQLFAYLARRNVMPKYGFPVDTVELRVRPDSDPVAGTLELSRDLAMAINEYAPGQEVVARGKLVRSAGLYRYPKRDFVRRNYAVCPQCERLTVRLDDVGPMCECGTPRSGGRRAFVIPEFGFVADSKLRPVGMTRPQGGWWSQQYVEEDGEQVGTGQAETALGVVSWNLHTRATLCVINEGPGHAMYQICETCGAGASSVTGRGRRTSEHPHPMTGRPCRGRFTSLALGHRFQTDLLALQVHTIGSTEQARSTLYAVLAGAADALEIARDDIDGTILPSRNNAVVLYDAVPGGAGLVHRVAQALPTVMAAALARVEGCSCGPETSCHRCLRVYRNQVFHEDLRRNHILALATSPFLAPTFRA